jgi:hypothetical protein
MKTSLVLFAMMVWLPSCAALQNAKPAIKTATDVARAFCAAWNAKEAGITAEQAVDKFCATEEQLAPFIQLVLAGEKRGIAGLAAAPEGACK